MILCEQNLAEFDLDFGLDLAEKIASELTDKDIELVIVDESAMKAINSAQRGIEKATDVLSFALKAVPNAVNLPLGSIVINANAVKDEAKARKHSKEAEFTLLFLHGILHLLGFDHEKDSGQMREKERQIIEKFKLPQSLIIRSES
mgnify:FL=1